MKNEGKRFKESTKSIRLSRKFLVIFIALLTGASVVFISSLWNAAIDNASEQSIQIAEAAVASLSNELLSELDASSQDFNKPEYDSLKQISYTSFR